MSKRKIIKMREPVPLDAMLCRDKSGELAIWFGDRKELKLGNVWWEDINMNNDGWLDIFGLDFSVDDFCKWFNIDEANLPKPGCTMPITIELPRWGAALYEQE